MGVHLRCKAATVHSILLNTLNTATTIYSQLQLCRQYLGNKNRNFEERFDSLLAV